mmetsp:Transcript_158349/g.288771  ORF Transcript_158349/g.288771 Transcript_158349/m.288771 type:complete len:349 (+) Transcript_158349:67-1113(+)
MAARCNLSTHAQDTSEMIGEGEFRRVTLGYYTEGPRQGEKCVCKVFKTGGVYEDTFFSADMKASESAVEFVEAFRAYARPFTIRINKPAVWSYSNGSKAGQRVLVEPHIANFIKFNSNTGKADNAYEVIQALSHFSYHHSRGEMCLCDLQGGYSNHEYTLSDVVILSRAKKFGGTDLGLQGIENFFHHHRCNRFCNASWIKCLYTKQHFVPTMTTTMSIPQPRPVATPSVRFQPLPSVFQRRSGPKYCDVCDRYHREGTTCPKDGVSSKDEWDYCLTCRCLHRPDTICPQDRPKPSENWYYCSDCHRRHRPETTCPKDRHKPSDDWIYCHSCDRRHRDGCPKRGRRFY